MITTNQTKAITALKNYLNGVQNYSLENTLLAELANVHNNNQKTRINTSIFGFLVIANGIPIPARERETKILETEQWTQQKTQRFILSSAEAYVSVIPMPHQFSGLHLQYQSRFIQIYYSIPWQKNSS